MAYMLPLTKGFLCCGMPSSPITRTSPGLMTSCPARVRTTKCLGQDMTKTEKRMVACHASHVTRYTSHVTRHTSHVTRHTSHVTRHTSHVLPAGFVLLQIKMLDHNLHSKRDTTHALEYTHKRTHRLLLLHGSNASCSQVQCRCVTCDV